MNRLLLALSLVPLTITSVAAQEKYPIKVRKEVKGDVFKVLETDSQNGKMTFTFMGKTQPNEERKTFTLAYVETVLEKEPGKRARKVKRTFESAELNRADLKTTPKFVGKDLLLERTAVGFRFSVDGKDVVGDDYLFLAEMLRDEGKDDEDPVADVILPGQPVALNEEWKPDVAVMAREMSKNAPTVIDPEKSTCTGKLLKVYTVDGRRYGRFEIDAKLALSKFRPAPTAPATDLDAGSTITMKYTYDGCIDGSRTSAKKEAMVDIKVSGTIKTPDGSDVKIDMNMKKAASKTQEQTGK